MLKLPLPPSANVYWRSTIQYVGGKPKVRVLLSREGRAFKKAAYTLLKAQRARFHAGDVQVRGTVYFENRRRDLDNCMKPIMDVLADGVCFKNDRQVRRIEFVAAIDKHSPRVELIVEPMP